MNEVQQELRALLDAAADGRGFLVTNIPVPQKKATDVKLILRRKSVTVADDGIDSKDAGADTVTFRVRREQRWIPEFAPGVAYLQNIAYPNFSTDSTDTVRNSGGDAQRMAAVAMLNIAYGNQFSLVYPAIQVGLGTGKDFPLLLAGGALRFATGTNLSLSAGVAFPWYQELKSLKPGDKVNGESALKQDLRYHLGGPSLYIGVQKGF